MGKANIKVINSIMGSGKSSYVTKLMIEKCHKPYLYVTPLLSEAATVMPARCAAIGMRTPMTEDDDKACTTKSRHLLELLEAGVHISTTHELFKRLTVKHIQAIRDKGYTIILDEVCDFISPYTDVKPADIKDLFARGDLVADKDNFGKLSMKWDVSKGSTFEELHHACEAGLLFSTSNPENLLNLQLSTDMLEAASEVIILTYMFESSTMSAFLKLHGYTVMDLIIPELVVREREIKAKLKQRIELVEIKAIDKHIENFGDTVLSHSWWERAFEKGHDKKVVSSLSNWLNNNKQFVSSFYFCAPKDLVDKGTKKSTLERHKSPYLTNTTKFTDKEGRVIKKLTDEELSKISLQGSTSLDVDVFPPKFVPMGTKATNIYRKRELCIVLSNVYANVNIQFYLSNYASKVDDNKFALSELVQYIFRGTIRNNDDSVLNLYLASPRMKRIFTEWLDG